MRLTRPEAAALAKETLEICENGYYTAEMGHVNISMLQQAAAEGTVYYPASDLPLSLDLRDLSELECSVVNMTALEAAIQVKVEFERLGVLNFASAKNPGGGFLKGSNAQEESLARSSGLYPCLIREKGFYTANSRDKRCIYTNGVIYSPNVPVFRRDNGTLLPDPYTVSFISCPAPNAKVALPRIQQDAKKVIQTALENRIDCFLSVAAANNCEALILGAFGCGVFGNAPQNCAKVFSTYLQKGGKYHGYFKKIVFAVPEGRDGNNQIFKKVFQ